MKTANKTIADKLRIIAQNNIKISERAIMKGVDVSELQGDLSLKTISGEQSLKNSMSFQKRVEEIIANNPHFNNPDYEGVNPYYNGNEN